MGHFMVAGRPSAKSFNHAAVKTYVAALVERKHRAECRDLQPSHGPLASVIATKQKVPDDAGAFLFIWSRSFKSK